MAGSTFCAGGSSGEAMRADRIGTAEGKALACLFGCDGGFARSSTLAHAPEGRERLPDDLVHVVVTVGREPTDEGHAFGLVGERLVALEQFLIFGARDRIIWITLGRRIFVGDRRV